MIMRVRRSLLATIAACLISWIVMCGGLLLIIPMFNSGSMLPFFWICLPVPFVFSLFVGWPTIAFLRYKHISSLRGHMVTGILTGALTALAYSLLVARDNPLRVYLVFLFISILHLSITAAIGYSAFWIMAIRGSPNQVLHAIGGGLRSVSANVMQEKPKVILIRFLGLLSLATVFYVVRPIWQPHMHVWFNVRSHVYFWHQLPELFAIGAFSATLCVLFELVFIAKLIVAYGLLRVRSWARPVAITVLTADFVFRAAGAITIFLFDAFVPPTPLPPIPEGTMFIEIPLWPSYVIAIISIASVFVLIQKPIKNLFAKSKSLTDNIA
ncbi:hypothetical protein ACFLQL_00935 [Verrucomicrobiota bacterium]